MVFVFRIGGGMTWHSSGLVGAFKPTYSQVLLAQQTIKLYKDLTAKGFKTGWKQCGSLNLARTRDRMTQFRRMKALSAYVSNRYYRIDFCLLIGKLWFVTLQHNFLFDSFHQTGCGVSNVKSGRRHNATKSVRFLKQAICSAVFGFPRMALHIHDIFAIRSSTKPPEWAWQSLKNAPSRRFRSRMSRWVQWKRTMAVLTANILWIVRDFGHDRSAKCPSRLWKFLFSRPNTTSFTRNPSTIWTVWCPSFVI